MSYQIMSLLQHVERENKNRIWVPLKCTFLPSDLPYLKVWSSFISVFCTCWNCFLIAHNLEKVFALITFMAYDWNACVVNVRHLRLFAVSEIYWHFLFQTCNVTVAKFRALKILFIYIVCTFFSSGKYRSVSCVFSKG